MTLDLPEHPRILIVRLSAIGDVVHGLPVLNALRARFPDAHLAWAVEKVAAPLLRGHEALDHLFELPRGWLKSFATLREFRREMHAQRFDLALDLQGLSKSAVAAWLSGAPRRLGYGGADGREISGWFYTETVEPTRVHVIDRALELLTPLGIVAPEVSFALPTDAVDCAKVDTFLAEKKLDAGFVVINPGAGWVSKLWRRENFAAVAKYLGERHTLPSVIVWAGEKEGEWAREIAAQSAGFGVIAPLTTLRELTALLRRARLFVGSDTGPLHIAVAVDTASVGLFGPMSVERNGPYGRRHIGLRKATFVGSSRERRTAPAEIMEAIKVADVCDACDQLLIKDGAIC